MVKSEVYVDPTSYEYTVSVADGEKWEEATEAEINDKMRHWTLVPRPTGRTVISPDESSKENQTKLVNQDTIEPY